MESGFKDKIIKLRKEGFLYKEISEKLRCAKSTVSNHCIKEGMGAVNKKVSDNDIKKMQEYYDECKSCVKVAEKFNISKTTVLKYIETTEREKMTHKKRLGNSVKAVQKRRKKVKEMAVEYKGGCCEQCGYNKCKSALEFHHLDPKKKDFAISHKGRCYSWEKVKEELKKCVMVCANCHREIHEK